MKRFLVIALGLIFAAGALLDNARAFGTDAGTQIINQVTALFSNTAGTRYTNRAARTNTVQVVYGIRGLVYNQTNFVSPGQQVWFEFTVTNRGNSSVTVNLARVFWRTNDLAHNGIWSYQFVRSADPNTPITWYMLAEDASETFRLVLTAPAAAEDLAAITNRYGAYLTNKDGPMAQISFYTGLNALIFGGWGGLTNNLAVAIVQAPRLQLAKSAVVSNSESFRALAKPGQENALVPGSEIVYSITWTNAGSGQLFGLTLTDPFPANVDYVANSVRWGEGARLPASLANYWSLTAIADGDGPAGTYGIKRIVNPTAVEIRYQNTIPGYAAGTVMYRVRVQ